jgi:tetratricopeptide (TPR) repeat protein
MSELADPPVRAATEGRPYTRFAFAILAIAFCVFIIQASARFGFSRLLGRFAVTANLLPAADESVLLTPSDPDAHRARATVLSRLQQPIEASKALESAASLRYRDDYLWLELANARENAGDAQAALPALDQAVRWAPFYAHTHWQRGNLLLRMRRPDEAFAELRFAATANRNYLPGMIDLAWGIAGADADAAERLVAPKDDRERRAFIWFLARKGRGREVLDRFDETPVPENEQQELVRLLAASKSFEHAFNIWYQTRGPGKYPLLFNRGFEDPLVLSNLVFGNWNVSNRQGSASLAVDVSQKSQGEKSLQITFGGSWDTAAPLLSQLLLIYPDRTYRVSFDLLTKDLATGGPPVISVSDATTDRLLGKSEGFPSTDSWRRLSFEFRTLPASEAIVIRLQRNNCDAAPCPIFGVVWLDNVEIEQQESASSTSD